MSFYKNYMICCNSYSVLLLDFPHIVVVLTFFRAELMKKSNGVYFPEEVVSSLCMFYMYISCSCEVKKWLNLTFDF